MEVIINKEGNIREKRALEKSLADNATAKANIDYIAMMTEVDIPSEQEGDSENGLVFQS